MKASSNIFLVGPMGAGKSTIGRLLAQQLGLEFIDTDKEIEDRLGVDIPWIFDMEGEQGFRDREQDVLEELSQRQGVLLATGGGVVTREPNRRALASRGCVVYLNTSLDEQVRRTDRDRRRPLLNTDDPAAVLARLYQERDPLYREVADFTVKTDRRSPKAVVGEICQLLQSQ